MGHPVPLLVPYNKGLLYLFGGYLLFPLPETFSSLSVKLNMHVSFLLNTVQFVCLQHLTFVCFFCFRGTPDAMNSVHKLRELMLPPQ
jgi:hypothetical protein